MILANVCLCMRSCVQILSWFGGGRKNHLLTKTGLSETKRSVPKQSDFFGCWVGPKGWMVCYRITTHFSSLGVAILRWTAAPLRHCQQSKGKQRLPFLTCRPRHDRGIINLETFKKICKTFTFSLCYIITSPPPTQVRSPGGSIGSFVGKERNTHTSQFPSYERVA